MPDGTTKSADMVDVEEVRKPSPVPRVSAADDEAGRTPGRVGRLRRRLLRSPRWTVIFALLVIVLLGLVAVGTVLLLGNNAASAGQRDSDDAVAAARQEVLALTTVNAKSAQQDLDRLSRGATGDFKNQFAQQQSTFQTVLTQGSVDSQGQVQEAGVVSTGDGNVVVLLAVNATVKNSQTPAGEVRQYRMSATMAKENGQWLMSKLEFVP